MLCQLFVEEPEVVARLRVRNDVVVCGRYCLSRLCCAPRCSAWTHIGERDVPSGEKRKIHAHAELGPVSAVGGMFGSETQTRKIEPALEAFGGDKSPHGGQTKLGHGG